MAIANDWYVDYQNRLIAHATHEITYDGEVNGGFTAGQTIGNLSSNPTKTAIIVRVTDNGTDGVLDVVYVNGSWVNDDEIYVGSQKRGDVDGAPTTKTTVYTTRALYSFLQDTFDELVQMDDTVPMSAQTPTEFTLINGWFIDDESTKYLSGGAITTSGYDSEIRVLSFVSTGYESAVVTDIGKGVTQAGTGDTGTLLHYNNDTRKWWIRMDAADDLFDGTTPTTNLVSVDSGTGEGDLSAASETGEDLYVNIYTLGTIATDPKPKTYVFQNSVSIEEWWGRGDVNAHIDVLIKVREASTLIGGGTGALTIFVRHYGDLYDHFFIENLQNGGRQAIPLATSTDLNNNASGTPTTGEIRITYSGGSGTWTVGQFARDTTTGAYGEILAIDVGNSYLYIGNVILGSGDFTGSNTIQESSDGLLDDGDASATISAVSAVVRGYNDIKIMFVNLTLDYTSGGTTTPTAGATITGASSGAEAVIISWTITSGTFAGGNAAGVLTLGNWNGIDFDVSEQLDQSGPTQSDLATAGNPTNQTVTASTTKAFEQGTAFPYNVIVDCASRTMAQVYEWFKYITREDANTTQTNYQTMYRVSGSSVIEEDGEEYIAAQSSYSPVKASPFGTLAGGKLFGARGVWLENMATADRQNFQLIDANGSTRTPPNFITITVSSVISGDKVTVFRTSSGTTINKTQFTALAPSAGDNEASDALFYVSESIPSDTPNSGYIRIVDTSDTSTLRETRYAYTSWSNSTKAFTLSGTTVLDRTYSSGEDTAYVPYYDEVSGNISVSVTVIYSSDQTVLTRVRRYNGSGDSILPFQITGSVTSSGYTVAAIRTTDTIVT